MNIKKFKKRVGFVFNHALIAFAFVQFLLLGGANFWNATIVALIVLMLLEGKELIGKLKERGEFQNTVRGNLAVILEANTSAWALMQTVGAVVIHIIVSWVLGAA